MGQESLEKISIQNYLIQWEKGLLEEADKEYLNSHFKIGEGADRDKLEFYQLYLEVFCTDNCELSNWIWKKINGVFEKSYVNCEGEIISLKHQPVEKIMNIYNNYNWNKISW